VRREEVEQRRRRGRAPCQGDGSSNASSSLLAKNLLDGLAEEPRNPERRAAGALTQSLRTAFSRAPELAPDAAFMADVTARLKAQQQARGRSRTPIWLALAAVLVVGIALGWAWWRVASSESFEAWAKLAAHAAGDHRYCALQHALDEAPISLEEAARRYDPRYAHVREVVERSAPVREGDIEVVGAHAALPRLIFCASAGGTSRAAVPAPRRARYARALCRQARKAMLRDASGSPLRHEFTRRTSRGP
jgi:hypothetical protein